MTETADDHALLAAARAGDERAFGRLVVRHRPGLESYCHLMLGCPHQAEEAVRSTVLRAWRGREGGGGPGDARIWLYRLATQACLERIEARDDFPPT
jgi:DNA-directed RNA polymerase specialized sigma24 family protein